MSIDKNVFVHETAVVDSPLSVGSGTKIWHFCHISKNVTIGNNCSLGQNVFIAEGVNIGNNVKIQNNVSIYTGVCIEDDVFLGPSCVFTNVTNPRAEISRQSLYEKTHLKRGCTIGANATIVCGNAIGKFAFVAAGAVVTGNVSNYALMEGVPAKQAGWMTRHGHPLEMKSDEYVCPESGFIYSVNDAGEFYCVSLGEDDSLPPEQAVGKTPYRNLNPKNK